MGRRIAAQVIQPREIGTEGEGVFFRRREIEAQVVLIAAILPRESELYLLNIGTAIKDAVGRAAILSSRAGQRADIKPARSDAAAIRIVIE
ncbi:MAG TPA: hypothetical protein VKE91_18620, partial [Blastocatellia bacterium]|nr:hypothetical protein [Blastocatellia bacterium]